ncbi:MAG: translation initiation factor IF-2 subunit beta [Halobacteriales archaeon]
MDYDELLDRGLEETPDIGAETDRFTVPDPVVRPEGHVTVYENFPETVDALDRDPHHVFKFLQNELGTSGHIDEAGRARLTGDFNAGRIEATIDDYVEAYVRCPECGLPDTHLEREKGALMLSCDACGARSATKG